MTELNYQRQAQDYYAKAPVIILGSGTSMAYGLPGMWDLAQHIMCSINYETLPDGENAAWSAFCGKLMEGKGLELALHEVDLSPYVTSLIVQATWDLIVAKDEEVYRNSITDRELFPLGKLLSHMLRTSNPKVDIVTTNYDCLAEYACDQEEIFHFTGFSQGFTRRLSSTMDVRSKRVVNIWKVHGSLDWFYSPDDETETVAITRSNLKPDTYMPQIVTPGNQKYHKTHLEPYRSIIGNADAALDQAGSYLCFGFGFNDEHIQPKLLSRCQRKNAYITVVTQSLTEQSKAVLFSGNVKNYLAIERADDGKSRIYSSQSAQPVEVDGDYWSLGGFLQLII